MKSFYLISRWSPEVHETWDGGLQGHLQSKLERLFFSLHEQLTGACQRVFTAGFWLHNGLKDFKIHLQNILNFRVVVCSK